MPLGYAEGDDTIELDERVITKSNMCPFICVACCYKLFSDKMSINTFTPGTLVKIKNVDNEDVLPCNN